MSMWGCLTANSRIGGTAACLQLVPPANMLLYLRSVQAAVHSRVSIHAAGRDNPPTLFKVNVP